MNFYDILFQQQNAEKVPYSKSYFDTLFAQKFSNIKTLTGTLPLTFTTSETKLRSWTIYGADIEHEKTETGKSISFYTDEDKLRDWTIYGNAEGVGERTKNVLDISAFSDVDTNNVVMTLNDNATISVYTTDTPAANTQGLCNFEVSETGNYLLSGMPTDAPNIALNTYIWDRDASGRAKAWDKTTDMDTCNRTNQSVEVYLEQGVRYQLRVRVQVSYGKQEEPVIVSPMVRKADTTPEFIPYGYIVPVQSGGVTTNIFIGSDPLTAGESVSKTSTGVDIPTTADATNVVQTPLFYNQPTIEIEYSYTGIGERTLNMLDLRAYRTPVDTGVIVEEVNIDRGVLKFSLDSRSTVGKGLAFEGIPFENGKGYVIDLWNNGTMSTWNPFIRLRRRDTGADIANVGGEFYQVGTNAFFFTYDELLAPEGAYLYIGTGMDKIVDVRSFYIAECPEGESRHFEPFGYQVPFKADQTGQMISYRTKVYIGTEPLKAGESVSNTKDARTHIGENTLSTTLTDPVTMKIKYKE